MRRAHGDSYDTSSPSFKDDTPAPSIPLMHHFFSFHPYRKETAPATHGTAVDRCGFKKKFFSLIPPLLLASRFCNYCFQHRTEEYTQAVYFLKNIYFIENKDRHLIVSSHETRDVFQAGAFLVSF